MNRKQLTVALALALSVGFGSYSAYAADAAAIIANDTIYTEANGSYMPTGESNPSVNANLAQYMSTEDNYVATSANGTRSLIDQTGRTIRDLDVADKVVSSIAGHEALIVQGAEKTNRGLVTTYTNVKTGVTHKFPKSYGRIVAWPNGYFLAYSDNTHQDIYDANFNKVNTNPLDYVSTLSDSIIAVANDANGIGLYNFHTNTMITGYDYTSAEAKDGYIIAMKADNFAVFTKDGQPTNTYPASIKAIVDDKYADVVSDSDTANYTHPKFIAVEGNLKVEKTIQGFTDGVALVKLSNNQKVAIDPNGKILFSIEDYDTIGNFEEGIAPVTKRVFNSILNRDVRRFGYINTQGKEIIPLDQDVIGVPKNGKFTAQRNGKWGVFNVDGSVFIPQQYNDMMQMPGQTGVYLVKKGSKYGIINDKNEVVAPFKYDEIKPIAGPMYAVRQGKQYSFMNYNKGFAVEPQTYDEIVPNMHEFVTAVAVRQGKTFSLINPYTFATYFTFPEGTTGVSSINAHTIVYQVGSQSGLLDFTGKVILEPTLRSLFIVG